VDLLSENMENLDWSLSEGEEPVMSTKQNSLSIFMER